MATTKKLMGTTATAAGGGDILAIEDVFSTYLYTGNGSTQTITNGIDLAGEGGLVWVKQRDYTNGHILVDTARGGGNYLQTNSTGANISAATVIPTFTSTGFNTGGAIDSPDKTYAAWTFRKAPRFFDVVTYTGNGASSRVLNHDLGLVPGYYVVKRRDGVSNWTGWHRSLGDAFIEINSTNAQDARGELIAGDGTTYIPPTDTQLTISGTFNISGATYVLYIFAHDPLGPSGDGSDGLIACGVFNHTNGTPTFADLGWEPQWVMVRRADSPENWYIFDTMRGIPTGGTTNFLFVNSSNAEATYSPTIMEVSATGMSLGWPYASGTYIYIAIRRGPMRQPESGTEVFAVDIPPDTADTPHFQSGFPVDLLLGRYNLASSSTGVGPVAVPRLTAGVGLRTYNTEVENTNDFAGTLKFDFMNGVDEGGVFFPGTPDLAWMFRRAPGFFDVVAYTGDGVAGRTVSHNLGVAPEMMIVKQRNAAREWVVYVDSLGVGKFLKLREDLPVTTQSGIFDVAPTDAVFTVETNTFVNVSGGTYIAYLFATLPGVSKVGSYTGNGSSQTIDCGFTSGARFILIKRTDSTGDWYVWDTVRGIVTGNDPHLSLNTSAAEVTSDDSIDPDSSGFIVNQVAATNINVSSASYIYLAIS